MLTYQVVNKHGQVFKIKTNGLYTHCIVTYVDGVGTPHWCRTSVESTELAATLKVQFGAANVDTLPATVDGDV